MRGNKDAPALPGFAKNLDRATLFFKPLPCCWTTGSLSSADFTYLYMWTLEPVLPASMMTQNLSCIVVILCSITCPVTVPHSFKKDLENANSQTLTTS